MIINQRPPSSGGGVGAGVLCTAQEPGSLTFSCTTAPTAALTANVLVLG